MNRIELVTSAILIILFHFTSIAVCQELKKTGFVNGGEIIMSENGQLVTKIFPDDFRDTRLAIGDSLPFFELEDLDGNPISFTDIKNKIAILNFTLVGCVGCRLEYDNLRKASDLYKGDSRVVFINFFYSDKWRIKRYVEKNGNKGYITVPISEKMYKDHFKILTAPTHIFVVNGKIEEAVSAPLWNEDSYLFITDFIDSQLKKEL